MFANSLAILGNRRFKARNIRKYVNANASSYDFTQFIMDCKLHSQHFSTIMGISANHLLVEENLAERVS